MTQRTILSYQKSIDKGYLSIDSGKESIAHWNRDITECKRLLHLIEQNELDYFENLIKNNEAQSIQNITGKHK